MPTPLLAGNWKLNGTLETARTLAAAVASGCADVDGRDVILSPPFTALSTVIDAVAGSGIVVAGQNLHWEPSGAFTGEISGPLLADAGCGAVILGHSERRQYFGETDYTVAKKVVAAHEAGLLPILCVGETLEQREARETLAVIEKQLRHGIVELPEDGLERLVVAYEPVWAIGTGQVATPGQAEEVHAHIRSVLAGSMPEATALEIRILYGGSVKPDNVDTLMACPNINGALVGGASLDAEAFLRIVHYEES